MKAQSLPQKAARRAVGIFVLLILGTQLSGCRAGPALSAERPAGSPEDGFVLYERGGHLMTLDLAAWREEIGAEVKGAGATAASDYNDSKIVALQLVSVPRRGRLHLRAQTGRRRDKGRGKLGGAARSQLL